LYESEILIFRKYIKKGGITAGVVEVTDDQYMCKTYVGRMMS
jgi:hypothetical protein